MNCPTAIAEILSEILEYGLVRIRAYGWENNAPACAREADHLHNLPALLIHYSPGRLLYYWDVERRAFLGKDNAEDSPYAPLWGKLEHLLPTEDKLALSATGQTAGLLARG